VKCKQDITTYRKGFGGKNGGTVLHPKHGEFINTEMRNAISLDDDTVQVAIEEE
jgi:hypothetical protein